MPFKNITELVPYAFFSWQCLQVKWVLWTTAIHSYILDVSGTEEVFFYSPLSSPLQQNTESWDNFQLYSQKHMSLGLDFLQQSATAGTVMSITNSWNPVWVGGLFGFFFFFNYSPSRLFNADIRQVINQLHSLPSTQSLATNSWRELLSK